MVSSNVFRQIMYLFLMRIKQHGEVQAPPPPVDARCEGGDVRLQLARHAQHLLGVALAGARQLLRARQQLLRVRVRVLSGVGREQFITVLYLYYKQ